MCQITKISESLSKVKMNRFFIQATDRVGLTRNFNPQGMELSRVGDLEDPLEGTNVTLICLIHTDGENQLRSGFPSPPEWYYRTNDTGEMQMVNKSNPPEGLTVSQKVLISEAIHFERNKKPNKIRHSHEEGI
jgi:hypothetical protein